MYVNKSQRVPLLHFSALCDIFREITISKISFFFEKNVLRFLSLRYSSDFRRSRLVGIFILLKKCHTGPTMNQKTLTTKNGRKNSNQLHPNFLISSISRFVVTKNLRWPSKVAQRFVPAQNQKGTFDEKSSEKSHIVSKNSQRKTI